MNCPDIPLPYPEVMALKCHLEEAQEDPEYTVVVNYPATYVTQVADYFGISLDKTRLISFPEASVADVQKLRDLVESTMAPNPFSAHWSDVGKS